MLLLPPNAASTDFAALLLTVNPVRNRRIIRVFLIRFKLFINRRLYYKLAPTYCKYYNIVIKYRINPILIIVFYEIWMQ